MKSRRMRLAEHVARMGDRRGAYMVLVGKREGKSPPGKRRHRWEDNIKVDLQEISWMSWSGLIWLRIRKIGGLFFQHGNEPSHSIKCGEFLE
jgi:hypothetical protein